MFLRKNGITIGAVAIIYFNELKQTSCSYDHLKERSFFNNLNNGAQCIVKLGIWRRIKFRISHNYFMFLIVWAGKTVMGDIILGEISTPSPDTMLPNISNLL